MTSLAANSPLKELLGQVPQTGRVEWIGVSPGRREPITPLTEVEVELNTGLRGDHHATGGHSKRQVTLLQSEHLSVVGQLLGKEPIDPALLRRNIIVSGVNLLSFKSARFQIGEVILQGTGPCAPCSLMEQNLGPGGYSAMRGHGGITTIVEQPGFIKVGDEIRFLDLVAIEENPV
jgi:MOSC domain-containing protein YiiM